MSFIHVHSPSAATVRSEDPSIAADMPAPVGAPPSVTAAAHATEAAGVLTLPLTEEQREVWLGAKHSEDASRAFNEVVVIRLRGVLDHDRLHACLRALVARHDALRTTFAPDGSYQRIAQERTIDLPTVDVSDLPSEVREARLQEIAVAEDEERFDLERGPLFRARLIVLGAAEHVLLFAYHHIVVDAWSSGVLLRELGHLYGSTAADLSTVLGPAMQFRELVAWEHEPSQVAAREAAEQYWTNIYARPSTPTDLPTDRPRPATKTFRSGKATVSLDPAQYRRVKDAAARSNCTVFHYLFAVYTAWLQRLTGSSDLVVGMPVAGQIADNLSDRAGSRSLVGHCVHFLPIRVACDGERPFNQHLTAVQQQLLEVRDHEAFTYGSLVKKLRTPRDPGRMPLVGVIFNLLPFAEEVFALEDLEASATFQAKAYSIFDLNIYVTAAAAGDTLQIHCEYNSSLFDHATVARWQDQWSQLIDATLAEPVAALEQFDVLTAGEREALGNWNRTTADYPRDRCLHELFEEQARRSPGRVAVVYEDRELTYGELDEQASRLAAHLRHVGVGPDVLVGICLNRSLEMVVAVLGVLKSGGAYVPIDPTYPADRVAFMLEDAAAKAFVTERSLVSMLPASSAHRVLIDEPFDTPPAPAGPKASPRNLAYVRYTSGSTGLPKGVQIEHRSIVNFIESMRRTPGLVASDVLLSATTLSFDIAELEIHLPLTTGARVVVVPWETAANGQALLDAIEKHGPTVMQATPATWRLMLEAGWSGTPALKILCGGEAMPPDLARQLIPRGAELWNMYGPTETTVWSTCSLLTDPADSNIGRPIANTDIYILDAHQRPVPIGATAELLIGGDGVARGYLNRPELTAERFVPHPFTPGARLYRTGDLARYRSNGQIECLGRLDSQVKVRGFRIELGEIEAVLVSHPDVRQAVVAAREDTPGDRRLVAYYTAREGTSPSVTDLREHVRSRVPAYMLPTAFVRLDSVPLTPNGKVDRKLLPAPNQDHTAVSAKHEPPATPIEEQLASIWARVLNVRKVGRHDNFFELGGNSLLAVKVFAEIEKLFGRKLPLATLFNVPTIAGLAGNVGVVESGTENWPSLVPIQAKGSKPRFFCVHGAGGNVLLYRNLVSHLGGEYPFYGLQSRGLDGAAKPLMTITEMAASYVDEVQRFQPHGPYHLGGYCLGGAIAIEMATLLNERGEDVGLVALLDAYNPAVALESSRLQTVVQRFKFHAGNFLFLRPQEVWRYLSEKIRVARDGEFAKLLRRPIGGKQEAESGEPVGDMALKTIQAINDHSLTTHRPRAFSGRVTLFKPRVNYSAYPDPLGGWGNVASNVDIVELPMNPHAMLVEPFVEHLASALARKLDEMDTRVSTAP